MSLLSRPATRFIGRDRELKELQDAMRGGARLLTVWGPPGVGKTRLALEHADRVEERYPAGVQVVSLSTVRELADLCTTLSDALEISIGAREPLDLFAERLSRQPKRLLVLDGFDRLIEVAGRWLQQLLERARTVTVVATSRQRLKLPLETPFELGPLADDAVELFSDRVRGVAPGFAPSSEQRKQIERIADRLNRIPLGLEIAAARADFLGLDGIEERLNDHLLGLSHRGPLESSQATLRDTIAWSWDLLGDTERSVLTQVAVFSGSFTLEAAESVVRADRDVLSVIADLRDQSFLIALGGGRLECYESVRQFALEVGDPDVVRDANERHRRHYLDEAERYAEELGRGQGRNVLAKLAADIENIRAIAFQSLSSDEGWVQAARAAVAARELWMSRGPIERFVALLDRLVANAPPEQETLLGLLLLARGASRRVTTDANAALADLERASTLLESSPAHYGHAQNELGVCHQQRRDLDGAREHYRLALEASREDPGFAARITGNLGALAHDAGDFEAALQYYEDALRDFRRMDMTRLEAIFLTNLALLRQELGSVGEAEEEYSMALELLAEVRDPRFEALAHTNRGLLRLTIDDPIAAHEDQRRALDLFSEVGDSRSAALARVRLGITQASMGDPPGARRSFDAAERILGPMKEKLGLEFVELARAFRELDLAQTARELEDPEGFERHRDAARARLEAAERSSPGVPALLEVFDDARIVASLLRTRLDRLEASESGNVLVVTRDAQRFRPPGGTWQDFGRKTSARRILAALVRQHADAAASPLSVDDIFEAGWGEQRIQTESRSNRVYVALSDLRKRGLGPLLMRGDDGYFLDPTTRVVETET